MYIYICIYFYIYIYIYIYCIYDVYSVYIIIIYNNIYIYIYAILFPAWFSPGATKRLFPGIMLRSSFTAASAAAGALKVTMAAPLSIAIQEVHRGLIRILLVGG